MVTKTPDDPLLNEQLLSKADALIRRNRPGGVGSDTEEIPVLLEVVDDLPELTDEVPLPEEEAPPPIQDLTATQLNPAALRTATTPVADNPASLRLAIEQSRRELMKEMLIEQERAVEEAVERVRAENKVLHARAIQAAYAQGKEEAEINYWPALQEARKEAIQTAAMSMSEHLITLDAYIAQAIEGWLNKELPQILSNELEVFIGRMRQQTTAHMRATLLPDLSEKLSAILDEALKNNTGD